FIAEQRDIRRVDAAGTIDTVAGTRISAGSSGDGGYGPFAQLNEPAGLALDAAGNLYIADTNNHNVRRLETSYLWISSSPERPKVGETITYKLTVSGLPETVTGATLTATLPAGVSFASASPGCTESAGTVTCALGTIQPGTVASASITVNALSAGTKPLTATVSAQPPVPGNTTASTYPQVSAANCGQTITASTVLSADIGPCVGNGVIVGASRITLDLGGHEISGFPGPGDGHDAGIRMRNRSAVTITNGTVSKFDGGVVIYEGRSNTVRNLTVRDNVGPSDSFELELGDGIFVSDSVSSSILNNTVTGSGRYDGIGLWGRNSDRGRVEGNVVEDTAGSGLLGNGIIVNGGDEQRGTITGAVLTNNTVRRSGGPGMANLNNVGGQLIGNTVEDNGQNGIGAQMGVVLFNSPNKMLIQGNQVHGNAHSGIEIISQGNTITGNNAANNATLGPRYGFDLTDRNANCGTNTWSNNIWGTGGYSPACTTTGGSGPALTAATKSAATADSGPPAKAKRYPRRGPR
ncbi:MAG: right-handed parallel beta-helix repeat-containing protein, partial [Actinobacteria bacterium]|nr:right-handed parallel beta-helix repeat-containing protein [Actinomycetota bacterium]